TPAVSRSPRGPTRRPPGRPRRHCKNRGSCVCPCGSPLPVAQCAGTAPAAYPVFYREGGIRGPAAAALQLAPTLVQALDADGLRRAQLLGKETDPQLLQKPTKVLHALVDRTLAFGHQ